MPVNISINTNTVAVQENINYISVNDPNNPNIVDITQPVTNTVEIITAGPQGPQGPQGPSGSVGPAVDTSSFVTTSSFNSYTGSNTSQFAGTASYVQNAQSASYVLNAISSSFATTASFVNSLNQAVNIAGSLTQGIAGNTASGPYSHAEGNYTTALGDYSHAEGDTTTASGESSHAEGFSTIAQGDYSHAEGSSNTASGIGSHAEGANTTASGSYSHAEGADTTASGYYSHAEGDSTHAEGYGSHAEGAYTVASGLYQHVQGQYNLSSSAQSAFIVGNGTADNARSNLIFASGSQVQITGSLLVTGSITGSLFGTSSYATNALTASFAPNYVLNSSTGSFVTNNQTSSFVLNSATSSMTVLSSSFSQTASFALNAGTTINTGSFVTTSSFNSFTSSYNTGSFTGSFSGSLFGTSSNVQGGLANYIPLWNTATSLSSSTIYQDGTGNLGIGTTSPLGILHLYKPAATTRMVMDGDAGQSKIITFRTNRLQRFGLYCNSTAESGANAGSDFVFRAYNDAGTLLSTPLFIKRSSGNIGIGTTAPGAKLDVHGSAIITGSLAVTGSLIAPSITGSLFGTASFALTSSYSTNIAGTTNFVSKFTGENSLGNSLIYDNGTNVSIGSTTGTALFNVSGSKTAASLIARGTHLTPTLVASANNDVLVGLDIAPTFSTGSFTGVTNYAQRISGNTLQTIDGTAALYTSNVPSATAFCFHFAVPTVTNYFLRADGSNVFLNAAATAGAIFFRQGNATRAQIMPTTGNLILQNGGTFTDDNVNKLQVSGSARITNNLTVTGSLIAPSITGSLFGTASYATQAVTASYINPLNQAVIITGSLRGNVSPLLISSTTASLNLATSNFFTLTLANGANTHISASNIQPGQTVNIRVTQGSAGTGTVSFNSAIKQSSGSLYTGSMITNAVDIVSLIAFDSTNAYISYINNFV